MCTSSRGWVATIFSMGACCCFALKVMHWWHLSTCSFACIAIQDQKKWSWSSGQACIQHLGGWSHCDAPSMHGLSMHGWKDPLKLGFLGVFGQEFSIQNVPPKPESGCILEGTGRGSDVLVGLHGLWPRVPSCILAVMGLRTGSALWVWLPIISSYAGNLQAIPYQIQDVQVPAICLNRSGEAFEGGFLQGLILPLQWSGGVCPKF